MIKDANQQPHGALHRGRNEENTRSLHALPLHLYNSPQCPSVHQPKSSLTVPFHLSSVNDDTKSQPPLASSSARGLPAFPLAPYRHYNVVVTGKPFLENFYQAMWLSTRKQSGASHHWYQPHFLLWPARPHMMWDLFPYTLCQLPSATGTAFLYHKHDIHLLFVPLPSVQRAISPGSIIHQIFA